MKKLNVASIISIVIGSIGKDAELAKRPEANGQRLTAIGALCFLVRDLSTVIACDLRAVSSGPGKPGILLQSGSAETRLI